MDALELERVKVLLKTEIPPHGKTLTVLPILHNDSLIILQFVGWSINLYSDGTWHWEDTTGG